MIKRRELLLSSIAALAARPGFSSASGEVLTAGIMPTQLAPDGYDTAELWCFDGKTPGPEIRVPQGAMVRRRFQNDLPEPSSVHWHGIRLNNAMDGVPGLTQDVVNTGTFFDYEFVTPDAGTYWYHSHNRSWEQLARGLYGPLIVEETEALDVDHEATLIFDDWRLSENGGLAGNFGNLHDNAHAGRLGNFITVNSKIEEHLRAKTGDRVRLRLINTANARIFDLGWTGMSGWIVALDGMPLEQPRQSERVTLAPAQRVDLIVDIPPLGDQPGIYMIEGDQGYVLADVIVSPGAQTVRDFPPSLPANPVPDLAHVPVAGLVIVLMEGGAMGGLQSARHMGEELGMRELAQRGLVWALNGVAGLTDDPLFQSGRNAAHEIQFINRTAFPHAMHLHGHHFREILADKTLGPWRDTLLVDRNEVRKIALVTDNPGKWLLHCHMLGHQAAGMKTWFEVGA